MFRRHSEHNTTHKYSTAPPRAVYNEVYRPLPPNPPSTIFRRERGRATAHFTRQCPFTDFFSFLKSVQSMRKQQPRKRCTARPRPSTSSDSNVHFFLPSDFLVGPKYRKVPLEGRMEREGRKKKGKKECQLGGFHMYRSYSHASTGKMVVGE